MANKFNFDRVVRNMEKLKTTLPVILANEAQNFFARSWKSQGFTDKSLNPWAPRAKETKKTKGKAIMVSTGKLRRAVQNSIREKSFSKIRLVIDGGSIPYAARHNNGEDGMPQRQFMGDSAELRKQQRKTIVNQIDKIWK